MNPNMTQRIKGLFIYYYSEVEQIVLRCNDAFQFLKELHVKKKMEKQVADNNKKETTVWKFQEASENDNVHTALLMKNNNIILLRNGEPLDKTHTRIPDSDYFIAIIEYLVEKKNGTLIEGDIIIDETEQKEKATKCKRGPGTLIEGDLDVDETEKKETATKSKRGPGKKTIKFYSEWRKTMITAILKYPKAVATWLFGEKAVNSFIENQKHDLKVSVPTDMIPGNVEEDIVDEEIVKQNNCNNNNSANITNIQEENQTSIGSKIIPNGNKLQNKSAIENFDVTEYEGINDIAENFSKSPYTYAASLYDMTHDIKNKTKLEVVYPKGLYHVTIHALTFAHLVISYQNKRENQVFMPDHISLIVGIELYMEILMFSALDLPLLKNVRTYSFLVPTYFSNNINE